MSVVPMHPSSDSPSSDSPSAALTPLSTSDVDVLTSIERRVLWLATSMIHHANRVRPNPSGLKVGGHQASTASMTTIMTTLWFRHLRAADRVSVKPHASPALHAINYLLGQLGETDLESLRALGGLQSYPSRTKDPDTVDYSTGSVGIGATATIWGAIARRYVDAHGGSTGGGRQYSLLGDAELDEGAIWEAVLDSSVASLGELVWIVDLNRQSLDRVVPNIAAGKLERLFEAAGWQVLPVQFGGLLHSLFSREGGDALRERIVQMSNPEYQRLIRCDAAELRHRLPGKGADAPQIAALIADLDDATLLAAFRDLGGHDIAMLDRAFNDIDDTRPTVILAYTLKGRGLPIEGHPQNHSSLLSVEQYADLAEQHDQDPAAPWRRFDPTTAAGIWCAEVAERLRRPSIPATKAMRVPTEFGRTPTGNSTTQAALGRTLMDVLRTAPEVGRRMVTVSPDVTSSTNLAGWLNKVGIWSNEARPNWFDDDGETIMHWNEKPDGQHIELGIAEVNLVGLIGELGATWSKWGEPLIPIGVLYDPFVERALEPWSFGIYSGGQSILVGTPSGITLAPEGGAHQSVKTPSIGLEQPGCRMYEPAFAIEVEWLLLAAMAEIGHPAGKSAYFRLSSRPVDQRLASVPADPAGREQRRRQVVAGGYLLRRAAAPQGTIVTMGAIVPEALAAAELLAQSGVDVDVVNVTSPDRLFEALQTRTGNGADPSWILNQVFPAERAAPMVTVIDGHPHALSFLAGVNGVRARHLGVSTFGQSGGLDELYRHFGLDADSIAQAMLDIHHG